MVSGVAVTTPPATSLALAGYPDIAGTASSFLGVARFAFGGLAAPLVGLGAGVAPLALVTLAAAALGALAYIGIRRPAPATTPAVAVDPGLALAAGGARRPATTPT